jgi:hypothetical protein
VAIDGLRREKEGGRRWKEDGRWKMEGGRWKVSDQALPQFEWAFIPD